MEGMASSGHRTDGGAMSRNDADRRIRVDITSVTILSIVFALVVLLVALGSDPMVAAAVASTSGLAATEINQRFRGRSPQKASKD